MENNNLCYVSFFYKNGLVELYLVHRPSLCSCSRPTENSSRYTQILEIHLFGSQFDRL